MNWHKIISETFDKDRWNTTVLKDLAAILLQIYFILINGALSIMKYVKEAVQRVKTYLMPEIIVTLPTRGKWRTRVW
jgi:hypothetical protein